MDGPKSLLENLTILSRRMRTVFDAEVRQKGLTLARARILLRLKRTGCGETQKALAEEIEVEAPTLVRILDGLEQAGSIRRVSVDGDRRAKAVELTEAGWKQAGDVDAILDAFRQDVMHGVGEAELETTLRVIRKLQANLEKMS